MYLTIMMLNCYNIAYKLSLVDFRKVTVL